MKKRKSCKKLAAVSAAALLLTGTLKVEHASAYFTTYVLAYAMSILPTSELKRIRPEFIAKYKMSAI